MLVIFLQYLSKKVFCLTLSFQISNANLIFSLVLLKKKSLTVYGTWLVVLSESFNFSEYDDFYNENFDSHLDELFAESGESDTNSSSSAYEIDVNEPLGASEEDVDDIDDMDFVDDDEEFIPLLEEELTERFGYEKTLRKWYSNDNKIWD